MKIKILLSMTIIGLIIAFFVSCNVNTASQVETPKYILTIPTCFSGSTKSIETIPQSRATTSAEEDINVLFNLVRMYLAHMEGAIEGANSIIYAIEKAKDNQNLSDGDTWTGNLQVSSNVTNAWIEIVVGTSDASVDFSHDGSTNSYRNKVTIKATESGTKLFELAYTKISDARYIGEFVYDYKNILGITDNITDQPKYLYFKFDSEDSNGDNSVLAKATWQDNSADTTGFPIRVMVNMVSSGDNFAIDGCSYHDYVGEAPLFTTDTTGDGLSSDNYRKRVYYFYGSANRAKDKGEMYIALPADNITQTVRSDIFASDFTDATNHSVGAIVKRSISYYICTSSDADIIDLRKSMNSIDASFSDGSGSSVTPNSANYTLVDGIMKNPVFWSNLSDEIKLWWQIQNPAYFDTTGYVGHIASPPSDGTSDYILGQSLESHVVGTNLLVAPNKLYEIDETVIVFPW